MLARLKITKHAKIQIYHHKNLKNLSRLIIEQKRQVSKVLLDGLYDPDCPLSMLLGVRTEIIGEIVWKEMLVKNWEIYSGKRIAFWKKVPRCWPFGRSSPVNKKTAENMIFSF